MEVLGIGPMELLLILIIALMVFGPDKLPEIGAKLGQSLRSVRRATHEFSREIEETRQAIEAPLNELKQPLNEITQPLNDLKQPFQELKQPLEDLRHPLRELGQAAQELPSQAKEALTLAAGTVEAAVAPAGSNGSGTVEATSTPAGNDGGVTIESTGTPAGNDGALAASAIVPGAEAATLDVAGGDPVASDAGPLPAPATYGSEAPEPDLGPVEPENTTAFVPDLQNEALQEPESNVAGNPPVDPASIATAVINPQEALRQVIARQMSMGGEGQQ